MNKYKYFYNKENPSKIGSIVLEYKNIIHGEFDTKETVSWERPDSNYILLTHQDLRSHYLSKNIDFSLKKIIKVFGKLYEISKRRPTNEEIANKLNVCVNFFKNEKEELHLTKLDLLKKYQEKKKNPFNKPVLKWKKYVTVISDHSAKRIKERLFIKEIVPSYFEKLLSTSVELTKSKPLAKKAFLKYGKKARYIVNFKHEILFVMNFDLSMLITVYDAEADWIARDSAWTKIL